MAKQTAPAYPFSPDEIVVALESYAAYPNIQIKAGTRLRATAEAVWRNPERWCKDGLSDQEMQTLRNERRPPREVTQHQPMALQPRELTDEESALCIKALRGIADGDTHLGVPIAVAAGQKVALTDRIVKANPDNFIPVVPTGLTRGNAVRALTDRYEYRRNADGVFIPETDGVAKLKYGEHKRFLIHYAGQWVNKDDPDVHAHPERYELLP